MNALLKLIAFLPRLKTTLQLSGLLVVAAAVVMMKSVTPNAVHANISLGAVGVLLVVFGQLFHFLATSIPARQRAWLLVTLFLAFCIFIIGLIAATSYFYLNASTSVVLMDSFARVYSASDKKQYRLNGATLSEILDDLPVNIIHEATYPNWVVSRCEQIKRQNPAVVVIHQSAFCAEEKTTADCHESESELIDFFRCMRETRTRFLVYTRYAFGGAVLTQAEREVPELKGRLFPFSMTRKNSEGQYTTVDFSDQLVRRQLKQRVRDLLSMPQ